MKYKLLLFLCFISFACLAQNNEELAEAYYTKAEAAFDNGDFQGAVTYTTKAATALGAANSTILYLAIRANYALLRNNYTDAVASAERQSLDNFFAVTDKASYPADKYADIVSIKVNMDDVGPARNENNTEINTISSNDETMKIGDMSVSKKDVAMIAGKDIKLLGQYIGFLCEKSHVNEVTKNAMQLFANKEDVLVEVTAGSKPPYKNKIRTYLQRLALLNYQHVQVTNHEIQFMSNMVLQSDGITYKGFVTFLQDFTATKDGRVVYSDVTRKTAEITLTVTESIDDGGNKHPGWRVYLGNIAVSQNG